MLLTSGLKERENSLAGCGELEGKRMGGGQQNLLNKKGQTALTE